MLGRRAALVLEGVLAGPGRPVSQTWRIQSGAAAAANTDWGLSTCVVVVAAPSCAAVVILEDPRCDVVIVGAAGASVVSAMVATAMSLGGLPGVVGCHLGRATIGTCRMLVVDVKVVEIVYSVY